MRIVHVVTPARSGLYQFHCNLLPGLADRGCEMTWLSSGAAHAQLISEFDGKHTEGEIVARDSDDLVERTKALIGAIEAISPDILIWPALGDPIELNAIRYVPKSVPRVLILHSSSLATYRGARAVREYVSQTVAISPRIQQDLVSNYGFHEDELLFIPHGIDTIPHSTPSLRDSSAGHVRILSHGRLVKNKGVYWLPDILQLLAQKSNDWECTISGDGPESGDLQQRLTRLGLLDRVRFTGWTPSELVPDLMREHDIFLFLSQFEGNPIALIEAMVSGCVPVSSRLPGISDWLIEDGVNGLQFPVGDTRCAVGKILELVADRGKMAVLGSHARESVKKYNLDWMSEQYYQLFCQLKRNPRQIRAAERLGDCELAPGLKPAWWYRLPPPIKNRLRVAREKIRASISIP